ncbi:hypothetical protein MYAER_3239 [Microcystis aeruginosa NIES-2549]|uniref:Uncharacterized protein n=1 Tax=Microcystis aeruginosa NIES-2549 TaxID=1641812 RepID=A0A0F6U6U1_MICAE|nr:hypothetical protein MYAER_3239 [Microcystis aeruginosa NIES-2549]
MVRDPSATTKHKREVNLQSGNQFLISAVKSVLTNKLPRI